MHGCLHPADNACPWTNLTELVVMLTPELRLFQKQKECVRQWGERTERGGDPDTNPNRREQLALLKTMRDLQFITAFTRRLRGSDTLRTPRVGFKPRCSRRRFTSGSAPFGPAPPQPGARRLGALTDAAQAGGRSAPLPGRAPSPAAPAARIPFSSLRRQRSRGPEEGPAAPPPPIPFQPLHLAAPCCASH